MTIDPRLLDDLRHPRAYPQPPQTVEVVQTHISCVFLAGDDVYKVKKAVRFSFLDFSTLERRRHYCEEEVRLNRRLAPDVYLGVVPIVRGADGHRVGGDGDAVEYAVHMRRVPSERLLSALITSGEADAPLMERIAAKVAAFHAQPDTAPANSEVAAPEEIARTLDETFGSLATHARTTGELAALAAGSGGLGIEDVRELTHAALRRIAAVLRVRRADGRVRDGHGDLRPDHVCCTAALPILDCVEFSARLRTCDVASDIAFLVSELDFHGAEPLTSVLIDAYAHASGDTGLDAVLPFFRAYRAEVRALVSTLTAAEGEVEATVRARQREDARRYLALATRRAWAAVGPVAIAIMGVSGSGKSTLARALAAATGFSVVRSDVIRKRLLGMDPRARPADPAEVQRLYAPSHSEAVYDALAAETGEVLGAGGGVIVDATFQRAADRDRLRAAAGSARAPLLWILCETATDAVHARLEARARRDDDPSDGTRAVAEMQRRTFAPPGEHDVPRFVLATDVEAEPAVRALRWLVSRIAAAAAH